MVALFILFMVLLGLAWLALAGVQVTSDEVIHGELVTPYAIVIGSLVPKAGASCTYVCGGCTTHGPVCGYCHQYERDAVSLGMEWATRMYEAEVYHETEDPAYKLDLKVPYNYILVSYKWMDIQEHRDMGYRREKRCDRRIAKPRTKAYKAARAAKYIHLEE
jgi:hypothetical protein